MAGEVSKRKNKNIERGRKVLSEMGEGSMNLHFPDSSQIDHFLHSGKSGSGDGGRGRGSKEF